MEKEQKRKLILELLESRSANSLEDLADKIMAIDEITPEDLEKRAIEEKRVELATLETKLAEAQEVITEITPKLAEIRSVLQVKEMFEPVVK